MTVAGRFDDIDIVHVIAQNLILQGTPERSLPRGLSTADRLDLVTTPSRRNVAGSYAQFGQFVPVSRGADRSVGVRRSAVAAGVRTGAGAWATMPFD
jgi:hypothetical protein